ncbi:MAG: DM13 domain-containing protein [Betaproteobacteria bacterium]|nr:MAG: DM13 domain-containing protein [Betaproteobacteria bacterium]
MPQSVDLLRYNTVVVWCETFSMFISAARYR